MSQSWRCPYCNQIATLTTPNVSTSEHVFNHNNILGPMILQTYVIVCPNAHCKEFALRAKLHASRFYQNKDIATGNIVADWMLRPQSSAKPFPEYVPLPIRDDYTEACSIVSLSPKASATLSRRCLQGMIRDFWSISGRTLWLEIQALKGKIDGSTWDAIDAVRSIGNIGAHMEADISVIVDVDPDEAQILTGLIETLIEEWYVRRFERAERMKAIINIAESKKTQRSEPLEISASIPDPNLNG